LISLKVVVANASVL